VDAVGRALHALYKQGGVDKETYKKICRKCTHAIVEKEKKKAGSFNVSEKKEAAIAEFAKTFYAGAKAKVGSPSKKLKTEESSTN
jgi:hypothetical protein